MSITKTLSCSLSLTRTNTRWLLRIIASKYLPLMLEVITHGGNHENL